MQFEAIIFDMDGLLVDSEIVWYEAEVDFVSARNAVYTEDIRKYIIGKRLDEFMVTLKDHYQFEESLDVLVDDLIARMMQIIPDKVKPQPGAREIIDYVQAVGIPHAIASSSPISVINATLESQGWRSLFDVRCTADDEAKGKPAPDVYLTAARRLSIDPKQCLALEDSPNGSRAAIAAGMTCFAVPDTSHSSPTMFQNITPHVFEDLHAVLATLKSG